MKNYQINSKVASKVNSNKDIVALFLALAVAGSLFYFISGPAYKKSLILKQEIGLKQKNLQSKKELFDNIENFNKNNKDLEVNVDKLKVFISNRNNYEDYLSHINNLASADNLEISNFKIEDSKKNNKNPDEQKVEKLKEKLVNFSVKGDFTNFLHFIKTLENSIPFIQEDTLLVSMNEAPVAASDKSKPVVEQIDLYPSLEYEVAFKFVYYQK